MSLPIKNKSWAVLPDNTASLSAAVRTYEARLIKHAWAVAGDSPGRLVRTAAMLGMHYQQLAYILRTRHKNIVNYKPAKRRQRSFVVQRLNEIERGGQ